MKQLVKETKSIITIVYPAMEEDDVIAVLYAIPDCTCLAKRPQSSEIKGMLEDIMPVEDILVSEKMVTEASKIKPLTYEQKDMIVSLFVDFSVEHEHLAWAAGTMLSHCKVLDQQQLLLIMKNAVCPLIQLNVIPGLFNPPQKSVCRTYLMTSQTGFMIQ